MTGAVHREVVECKDSVFVEILEKMQDAIVLCSPFENATSFIITYVNKALETRQQVQRQDIQGRPVSEALPEMQDSGLTEVMQRVLTTGKPEHHVAPLQQDQRISGWVDTRVSKLANGDLVSVSKNQTENIHLNDSLHQSHLFFETIFETIQDGLAVLDTEMRIIRMNRAMEQWYRPLKPYLGNTCYHIFHRKNEVCDQCPAAQALRSGKKEVSQVPRGGPMGTPGWIELSAFPIIDPQGVTVGVVEHVRNISSRKAIEEALMQSEQKMQEIIEFLPDPTWVIDRAGVVIQWNQAIEQLTGILSQDIIGKNNYEHALPFYNERRPILIDLVLKHDPAFESTYSHLEKQDDVWLSAEVRHQSLGGKEVYLSAVASPLYDIQGNVVGAIETLRDITTQKRAEKEREELILEQQEALTKVRTLSGFLPICAGCKKIRDDKGYWNQIESYIRDHSDAEFSHSLCPDCVKEMYGNQDWYKNK